MSKPTKIEGVSPLPDFLARDPGKVMGMRFKLDSLNLKKDFAEIQRIGLEKWGLDDDDTK